MTRLMTLFDTACQGIRNCHNGMAGQMKQTGDNCKWWKGHKSAENMDRKDMTSCKECDTEDRAVQVGMIWPMRKSEELPNK